VKWRVTRIESIRCFPVARQKTRSERIFFSCSALFITASGQLVESELVVNAPGNEARPFYDFGAIASSKPGLFMPNSWRNGQAGSSNRAPVAAKAVEENVADDDGGHGTGIEPEEHSHPILRPEVLGDPLHESAVQKGFIEDVDDVRREECPEKQVQERHPLHPYSLAFQFRQRS
jgi:hypothetical protein